MIIRVEYVLKLLQEHHSREFGPYKTRVDAYKLCKSCKHIYIRYNRAQTSSA